MNEVPPKETDPRAWLREGQSLWRRGRYRRAVVAFERAWHDGGGEPAALALIRALLSLGWIDEALERVERHLSADPRSPEVLLYRALARFDAGDMPAARATLQRARSAGGGAMVSMAAHYLAALAGKTPPIPPGAEPPPPLEAFAEALEHHPGARFRAFPIQVLLDGLETCPATGAIVECGVYWGRSIRILAERSGRPVHGFDSFEGLPEDWKAGEPRGAYSTGGELPAVPPGVTLHRGWFADTLPAYVAEHPEPIALLHVDCDLYSSTRTVLGTLAPLLHPGSVLVFDDYWGFPGWREHEYRAFREFSAARELSFRYLAISLMGREVALMLE